MPLDTFLWGHGGRRLTPDDIARERAIAASLQQSDYSPIQSPWQGLARVSGNILGALHERRAEHAYDANQADQSRLIASLLGGGDTTAAAGGMPAPIPGGMAAPDPTATPPAAPLSQLGSSPPGVAPTPPGGGTGMPSLNPAIAEALSSPYADAGTRALALQQYRDATKHAQPIEVGGKLVDVSDPVHPRLLADYSTPDPFSRLLAGAGIDPNSPEGIAKTQQYIGNRLDPIVSVPLPGGNFYTGPRSGMASHGAGTGTVTPQSMPPATLPPDFDFGDEGSPRPAGAGGFPVSNGAEVISGLFPGAHVTDNRRPADSALGRANPNSYHVRSGGAVDVRPIPGMSFAQYLQHIKAAGYSVIEARDEVRHPSAHATGPHWHVVIGGRQ